MNKKIGLFGGSFNPIHNSHIAIIKKLLKSNLVDEVWIMPARKHAFNKKMASVKDRLAMIQIAIEGLKKVKICVVEINAEGKNYTSDTLKKLRKKYKYEFILINGSDTIQQIKKWHKYKAVLSEAKFIIFKRRSYSFKKIRQMKILKIIGGIKSNSSTDVRKRILEGKSIKNLVPAKIAGYISKKRLYRNI